MEHAYHFESLRKDVDAELATLFLEMRKETSHPFIASLYEWILGFVCSGGKRLRPVLTLAALKGLGKPIGQEERRAAVALELLHASTLIHDDIMDEDTRRRGSPSLFCHYQGLFRKAYGEAKGTGALFATSSARFGASQGIIAGNLLYVLGFFCLDRNCRASEVYRSAAIAVNEGQVLDLLGELEDISEESYLAMTEKKTASLFIASAKMGAVLGNADERSTNALQSFALSIAMAFQLQDDIIDISPDAAKGNTFASDIRNSKKTLLVIRALAASPQAGRLREILAKKEKAADDLKEAVAIIGNSSLQSVKDTIEGYYDKGICSLERASLSSEGREFLAWLAGQMVHRKR
ncbi:TPA: polyprenyl synthetase family protein [Candidatus Woesearchaeota archaeon]|nr:polyprenyl synthetase family protein [Candidatus Woesearchaeota archaeon]HII69432.1 polyprenyl synthetase family protein [Candidatus Woesearchaeota archaeon]